MTDLGVAAEPFECALVWGKARGLSSGPTYPLVGHLVDAAACARVLMNRVLSGAQRDTLVRGLGVEPDRAPDVAAVVAGWHDVGKAVPAFQALMPSVAEAMAGGPVVVGESDRVAHGEAGYWHLLAAHLEHVMDAGSPVARLAQVVGGHHGVIPPFAASVAMDGVVGSTARLLSGAGEKRARWGATRDEVARLVESVAWAGGRFDPTVLGRCDAAASVLLSGVTVMADWLVSQTPVIDEVMAGWAGGMPGAVDESWVVAHHEAALVRAERLVEQAGLTSAVFEPRPFATQFPGYTPRGAQQVVADVLPSLVTGPGMVVVMAPTGDGKTESALHAASVLAGKSDCSGVLVALPTMATTNAMYSRVREFAGTAMSGRVPVTLLHSLASLNDEYGATRADGTVVGPEVSTECDGGVVEVTDWMMQSGRGLLAPHTVCTIDQLLMAVLRGKHSPLRLSGASRKVVIIDEAHSYDTYMHALLCRALTWLAGLGAPVVLLSATLSESVARDLVAAYVAGLPAAARKVAVPAVESMTVAYPGWVHVDAGTGAVNTGDVPPTGRERELVVEQVEYAAEQDASAIAQSLTERVRGLLAPVTSGARDGNVLVVCNTVRDAVAVYEALRDDVAGECPVMVMHSRFPNGVRGKQADLVAARYGKHSRTTGPDGEAPARPARSVLVATQVVEQSLDLDMDWVVSDLAPAAMLLQRAGRGHRHQEYAPTPGAAPVATVRPVGFEDPTLTVLVPVAEPGGALLDRDRRPYDQTLLVRTRASLAPYASTPLRVPEDVQDLVNDVYDGQFTDDDTEIARYVARAEGAAATQSAAAATARIPTPRGVDDGGCLSVLTNSESADGTWAHYSTRYGLNTATVIPVWDKGGQWSLTPDRLTPIPGATGPVTRAGLRRLVEASITTPGGAWCAAARENVAISHPVSWARVKILSDTLLLPVRDSQIEVSMPTGTMTHTVTHDTGLTSRYERG